MNPAPAADEYKVQGQVAVVLYKHHVKHIKAEGAWPSAFDGDDDDKKDGDESGSKSNDDDDSDEDDSDEDDSDEDEEEEDPFANGNPNHRRTRALESSSDDSSDESSSD